MIHARNFKTSVPYARITAVCDPVGDAAAVAAKELDKAYTDYRDVMADDTIDAVIIATPTKFHCEIAANAKKHILCEKPMVMTVEECGRMERAARVNGVKLQIAFMRRFDRSFAEAKRMISAGTIGDVVMVRSNTRGPASPSRGCTTSPNPTVRWRRSTATISALCAGSPAAISRPCSPSAAIFAAPMPKRIFPISMTMWS